MSWPRPQVPSISLRWERGCTISGKFGEAFALVMGNHKIIPLHRKAALQVKWTDTYSQEPKTHTCTLSLMDFYRKVIPSSLWVFNVSMRNNCTEHDRRKYELCVDWTRSRCWRQLWGQLLALLTYLCPSLPVEHRPSMTPRHRTLFWAALAIPVQFVPCCFSSASASRLQLLQGWPLFLFPCGFQVRAYVMLGAGFLRVCPIQPHFLGSGC